MLASPKREGNLWPASVSLFNLECVETKIGYNQTRVCRRVACPSGASDSVSPRAHMNLYHPPPIPIVPICQPATAACSLDWLFLQPIILVITIVSSYCANGPRCLVLGSPCSVLHGICVA